MTPLFTEGVKGGRMPPSLDSLSFARIIRSVVIVCNAAQTWFQMNATDGKPIRVDYAAAASLHPSATATATATPLHCCNRCFYSTNGGKNVSSFQCGCTRCRTGASRYCTFWVRKPDSSKMSIILIGIVGR